MAGPAFELYRLDRELSREEVIAALDAMPVLLRDVIAMHDAAVLGQPMADGEWSPIEVVRHFRDIAQVYGMRFKWMILQDEPLLANYDENRWAAESPDGPAQVESMLAEIAAYRAETVRLLRSLTAEGWSRRGRHETIGIVELEPYVRHELSHEEQHLEQLRVALAGA